MRRASYMYFSGFSFNILLFFLPLDGLHQLTLVVMHIVPRFHSKVVFFFSFPRFGVQLLHVHIGHLSLQAQFCINTHCI